MGLNLWKIKFEMLHDHLTDEEYDFLTTHGAQSEDGNWYITEDMLKDALEEMKEEEISRIQDLLYTLRKEFEKEKKENNSAEISFNFG